ncbi:MAG: beta-propeller fold lactonase family protein [Prevotellaceae bacterium]|jgi:YVTN family beta-propeller protein|nr:beta-propeller fold lactonase family protein [Prevotellaceae bacterium]
MKYCVFLFLVFCFSSEQTNYLSPGAMAVDKNRDIVYTVLTGDKAIAVTDLKTGQTSERIDLKQNPNNILISPDGATLYVSCGGAKGSVEIINLENKKRKAITNIGHTPQGMALSKDGNLLYAANRFSNTISAIDLSKKKIIASIPAVREPRTLCLLPDGTTLAVANFLPAQAATDSVLAAQITLIDLQSNTVRSNITLPNGAQSVAGLAFSPDGNYLYAVHLLSRYNVPITQLDRGWVNTNALSIIDRKKDSVYATVLLDDVDHGAANPAGICAGEDQKLYIALSGTHELMILDGKLLHENLTALFDGSTKDAYIRNKEDLSASLSFVSPFKKRIALQGRSPRDVVIAGDKIIVSSYFSPFLEQISTTANEPSKVLPLGIEPDLDAVRRGELAFYDASICYQQWQSCASCHPDGRIDGLNWDQQNDGLGNPKNTKSLLYSHVTPPCMITGVRESAEKAVRNGILHTLQTTQPETIATDMDDYLKQLKPLESPYLSEYKKKDSKQKGKKLFEQSGCILCHSGEYLTDQKKYDVGTGDGEDKGRLFDTPSLREIWRTAPYLYDGRATTLHEVLTTFNREDKHGVTTNLSKEELDALVLYINTL